MSEWISVKDQLPNDEKVYLCIVKCIGVRANHIGDGSYCLTTLTPDRNGFYVEFDEYGENPVEEVTHWMQIPEPPK